LGLAVDEDVPDDTTISCFRAQRLGEEKFRQVFEQIVRQCIDKGLVKGKRQIIDSTHIIADIAINSLTRKEDNLEEEIEQAKALLDGVTEELTQGKLKVTDRLRDNINVLEKAVADREEGAEDRLVSPVDKDARARRKTSKHWAGYKGHVVMEEESEIITAVETTSANKPDGNQLPVLLQQQEESVSLVPQESSADKAYGIGANLEILDSKNITGNISLIGRFNRLGPGLFTQDDFKYNKANDTLTCPAGCLAPRRRVEVVCAEDQHRKGIIFQFSHHQCSNCGLKVLCFPVDSKKHGRGVNISVYEPLYKEVRERMKSEAGQEAYRNRYRIEHKVADLARWCGMRRCRYRGLARARIHTLLSAITSNIKRMARILCRPPLEAASAC